ncbi:MAG: hypothetical protein Q4F58_00530, partial [Candidatus Saccharibacteria bacterium]|nr:hypothetical protein [Candidatus Saccharibacteria bacterium]
AGNTKVIAYNNPGTVCNGTIYQTGDILTLNPNDTNNINIYAMWIPTTFDQAYLAASKTKDATSGYYTMQDMSATICNAVSENQITTLTDTRINGSYASRANYTIVKLPDGANGRCWMADNIALDLTNSTTLNSISITNTHVDTASLTSLKSGNRSANARYATAGIASSWTTTDSYTQAMIKKSGINCDASINTNNPCNPNGGTGYSYNSVALQSSGYGISANKLGIFYNYCAASAGNYCYDSNQTTTNNADYDICPANWRLPTGGLSSEPYELFMAIPSATITDPLSIHYRLSAPLSGLYRTGSAWWQGVMGQFLTSTRSTNSRIYMFQFGSGGGVGAQSDATRNGGRPVRCIAQN